MVQVKASEAVAAILTQIKGRAELVEDHGMLLGYIEPVASDEDALCRGAAALFDPEMTRRSQEADGPCSTTTEIRNRLHAMGDA